MPFIKADVQEEKRKRMELLKNSVKAREAHALFEKEIALKQALIDARKKENLTQQQLSELTGLSQQAISRLEKGVENANVSTLLKYLNGLGYQLTVSKW